MKNTANQSKQLQSILIVITNIYYISSFLKRNIYKEEKNLEIRDRNLAKCQYNMIHVSIDTNHINV
jgi:CRISPR/Cas system CSM-associated protein Csm4 (group 5 of RAMP superfamily)